MAFKRAPLFISPFKLGRASSCLRTGRVAGCSSVCLSVKIGVCCAELASDAITLESDAIWPRNDWGAKKYLKLLAS